MLRSILRAALWGLWALLMVFVLLNLTDARSVENELTASEIKPASLERENGFYRVWTLGEDKDADIMSDAALMPIRAMFDPSMDNDPAIAEYKEKVEAPHRSSRSSWKDLAPKFPEDGAPAGADWVGLFTDNRSAILADKDRFTILLDRYTQLLQCARVEDFSIPRPDTPIPNLIILMKSSKLYTGIQMVRAADGDAEGAIAALLDQIDFCRRLIPNARTIVVNIIGKAVMHQSLLAVSSLLSQPACPAAASELLLKRLPPLNYEEYGTRQAFVFEYLAIAYLIDHPEKLREAGGGSFPVELSPLLRFLRQSNRTKQLQSDLWRYMLEFEALEPYKWGQIAGPAPTKPTSKHFWWMQNPGGKILGELITPDMSSAIHRAYRLKARHDMVRISAELNLARTSAGGHLGDMLSMIESYRAIDPYSGRSYLYNEQRSVIYSVGADRADGGGAKEAKKLEAGTDLIVPLGS